MKIIVIRHFKTRGNLERRYVGWTDEPLLKGGEFAKMVEEKRNRLWQWGKPDWVITSPMKRCIQTAALLFPEKKAMLCSEMRECNFGLFEGKNYEELKDYPAYQEWINSHGTISFPEGESREVFKARSVEGFEKVVADLIQKGCETAAMVVHGGTIMAVLSQFDRGTSGFYDWQIDNGDGYAIFLDEAAWNRGRKEFGEIERL